MHVVYIDIPKIALYKITIKTNLRIIEICIISYNKLLNTYLSRHILNESRDNGLYLNHTDFIVT